MRYLIAAAIISFAAAGCKSVPTTVWKAQEATRLVKEADALLSKSKVSPRDLDSAVANYEKSLELAPRAPRHRFAYAQLLFIKGMSYSQEANQKWQGTLGRKWISDLKMWEDSPVAMSGEKKQEVLKESAQSHRDALIWFNKSLQQLHRCDREWNYSVEAVPFAMGIVYIFMDKLDKAIAVYERVLDSRRVRDEYKENITDVIRLIKEYQRKAEEEEDLLP